MPDKGYELESIAVHKHDNRNVVVATCGTGNRRTFMMPSYPIAVEAVFRRSGSTSVEETHGHASLRAYAQNGMLHVSGAAEGATVRVYSVSGVLISTIPANAVETRHATSLPGRGIYIVTDGTATVKVINN